MLIELSMILMGVTSCDVSRAALGACEIDCTSAAAGSFTVCASQGQSSVGQVPTSSGGSSSKSKPKPQRSCQYYVNGTIDVPTIGIITAWVDVGSRLCIGDPVPATYESDSHKAKKRRDPDSRTVHGRLQGPLCLVESW